MTSFGCSDPVVQIPKVRIGGCPAPVICSPSKKDKDGQIIEYTNATAGHLKFVTEDDAKAELAQDYAVMLADEVMVGDTLAFEELLELCVNLQAKINSEQR